MAAAFSSSGDKLETGGISVNAALVLAALIGAFLAAALASSTLQDLWKAKNFLARAERSYEQLSVVTRIEADVNALLLNEAARENLPEWTTLSQASADKVERSLSLYLASVGQEAELLDDQGRQGEEVARALELRDLFQSVRANLAFLANQPADAGLARDGRNLAARRVAADVVALRSRAAAIVEAERNEVAATNAEMAALRGAFLRHAGTAALLLLAGVLAAFRAARKGFSAPLRALARGAETLADGDRAVQVAPRGLRELRQLARQFNEMAARILSQQGELEDANRRLEETVARRTRELEAKTEQLAQVDRSRKLFFAKVSHELRTPATVLLGEAGLALRQRPPDVETLREALRQIRAHGEVMQRRLDDMLLLAQSDEGRLTLHLAPFDLACALREALDLAGAFARASGVALIGAGLDDDLRVSGDESWLRQGVLALIDNAVKFSPDRGEVTVALAREGGRALLSVSDQGPGAPGAALERLFDPYYQSEEGARRGGSGLGLAVARWIAEQHGGAIAAENRPEGGLKVTLILPASA
ncbi:signal transduction histidine kinase [Rhodoblastus acidophilus]|uniref:HAMP domain-containing sensor histidine kinase n=1 Tax=Rhodoblastus acidophilus TaxID=1074 RepID=UPI0022254A53|nr:ATP-binding protein [Rhodoblastus acidophilus]MCW2283725.1 signal transduction histidine kinase [Rhodoblastus acidophilus]MCW2332926.1 signal transduction histidine kinase [Rhodoblastus acidophilus]